MERIYRSSYSRYHHPGGIYPWHTSSHPSHRPGRPHVPGGRGPRTKGVRRTRGCCQRRVAMSIQQPSHEIGQHRHGAAASHIYASGWLLWETITTTAAVETVTHRGSGFAYDAQGIPFSTYTNGTASPVTYYITKSAGRRCSSLTAEKRRPRIAYDPYGQVLRAKTMVDQPAAVSWILLRF